METAKNELDQHPDLLKSPLAPYEYKPPAAPLELVPGQTVNSGFKVKKIWGGEMMRGNDLRLIELAFDYVSAETEPQAKQARYQATMLAIEATTLNMSGLI